MDMNTGNASNRKKVLCPITGKDGKTFWAKCGIGFPNKDGSYNLYLDLLPINGKLQLRDWDEQPWTPRGQLPGAPQLPLLPEPQHNETPF